MAFNISAASIRQPVPSIVLFVVLCFLGWMSYLNLPITRFPNIDVPLVQVAHHPGGRGPAELESQITKRVEDAVANITGVKNVISNLTDGVSSTVVEFRLECEHRPGAERRQGRHRQDPRRPAAQHRRADHRAPRHREPGHPDGRRGGPAMTIEQLSWFVDDTVKRELQGLRGIGRISRNGGVLREIRVALDPNRLMALGITAAR